MRLSERFTQSIPLGALAALALVVLFTWTSVLAETNGGELTVAFLDVGQGDAIFIEAPSGRQLLIDGGRNRAVLAELAALMPFWDRSIDVVLATHPDADHIGGLVDVLERYEVDYIIESGNVSDTAVAERFVQLTGQEGAEHITARRGMRIELGDGVVLDILFPDRDVSGIEPNAASVMAKLSYGDTSVMLTGDAPSTIERHLVALDGSNLASDLLKAGHHGSKTSNDVAFLGYVAPEVAIISAGRDNRYGHPHQEVLDALSRFGINTLGTYDEGTITFVSDGASFRRR